MKWAEPVLLTTCVLLGMATADPLGAQSAVAPDRPDVTNGTATVPPGALQIETGIEYARSRRASAPAERRLAGQLALRTGLAAGLELRLEGEPLVRLRGGEDDTGPGDLELGFKYRFLDSAENRWWPAVGIQPFVKLPVASAPIGTARPDWGVLALASFDLPWQLGLDVNAGLVAVGQSRPRGYLLRALASASLSWALAERWSPFVELFFASRDEREGRDALGFDAGVIYFVTRRLALDAAVETSLAGRSADYVVRAGFTVRFGR